jgi:hypothetical protein
MTEAQLKNLYKVACDGKGFVGNDGQFKVWKQTLGWTEEKDLAKALVWWFTAETDFPMPALLKPLIERSRRERIAKASQRRFHVRWQCTTCHYTMQGFLAEDTNLERYCQSIPQREYTLGEICGGNMEVIYRELAQEAAD